MRFLRRRKHELPALPESAFLSDNLAHRRAGDRRVSSKDMEKDRPVGRVAGGRD